MIAGGGTGGHLFPGIAVAEAARRRDPNGAILFVGSERGLEARIVPSAGFALEALPTTPLRGRGARDRVRAIAGLAAGVGRARGVIRRFAPDAIVGLGGYASAPAVIAGRLAATPIVLLEQNARPGLTTRLLARFADRVCVSFPESAAAFAAGKAVVTGNPVRWRAADGAVASSPAASSGTAMSASSVPTGTATSAPSAASPETTAGGRGLALLIFGGSAGARTLNLAGPALAAALADVPGLSIVHQTGAEAEASVRAAYAGAGIRADVRPFIADMGAAYAAADVVVCRAGATTIAELAALGKPAILVPYPYAADDHQRANAESLVAVGAAAMVLDAEASGERLAAEVRRLLAPAARATMAARVRALAHPDAAERVLATVEALVYARTGGRRRSA
ncbi:MAG: undecaprenyldiphospho-muramoylpentapeptide beta-N-acetylglucosaminyltransferase [Deltaproteobacteria bacterium]|nr:MAG: undecaprenyldiphospho-muramoylpentapeptide beta-N-acetylglucosaminyltransferase [Deltaproteobacteria bacterium]